jgi:hypothetical protein
MASSCNTAICYELTVKQKRKRADGKSMVCGHALFHIHSFNLVASRILVRVDFWHRCEWLAPLTSIKRKGNTYRETV